MKGHVYQRTKGSWTIVYDLPTDAVIGKQRHPLNGVISLNRGMHRTCRVNLVGRTGFEPVTP